MIEKVLCSTSASWMLYTFTDRPQAVEAWFFRPPPPTPTHIFMPHQICTIHRNGPTSCQLRGRFSSLHIQVFGQRKTHIIYHQLLLVGINSNLEQRFVNDIHDGRSFQHSRGGHLKPMSEIKLEEIRKQRNIEKRGTPGSCFMIVVTHLPYWVRWISCPYF